MRAGAYRLLQAAGSAHMTTIPDDSTSDKTGWYIDSLAHGVVAGCLVHVLESTKLNGSPGVKVTTTGGPIFGKFALVQTPVGTLNDAFIEGSKDLTPSRRFRKYSEGPHGENTRYIVETVEDYQAQRAKENGLPVVSKIQRNGTTPWDTSYGNSVKHLDASYTEEGKETKDVAKESYTHATNEGESFEESTRIIAEMLGKQNFPDSSAVIDGLECEHKTYNKNCKKCVKGSGRARPRFRKKAGLNIEEGGSPILRIDLAGFKGSDRDGSNAPHARVLIGAHKSGTNAATPIRTKSTQDLATAVRWLMLTLEQYYGLSGN